MRIRTTAAALAAAALLAAAPSASAQEPAIQPGSSIESNGSYCTLAWIFDGATAGEVYGSTAAHCVEAVGDVVNLADGALGDPIESIGTVAFLGNAEEPGRDYAFIRIEAEDLGQVDGALKGWPAIPTGISTSQTANEGDLIQFSGHGVGFSSTQPTQEQRKGVLNIVDYQGEHQVLGAVTPGDSGGPVANITDGNKALGIVNTVGVGVNSRALVPAWAGEGGANLEFVLADAASRGFGGLTLRTVAP